MANSWNQPVKQKKSKKVVPVHVSKRHTIEMTRDRKADLVATEIRKAQKKLARREDQLLCRIVEAGTLQPDKIREEIEKRDSIVKLRAHINHLETMHKRLKAGDPAEVRTRADYAPSARHSFFRWVARKAPANPSPSEAPAATVPPPATPDPAPAP